MPRLKSVEVLPTKEVTSFVKLVNYYCLNGIPKSGESKWKFITEQPQQKGRWYFTEHSGVEYHQTGGKNCIQVQFRNSGWHWKAKCPHPYQPALLSSFHTNDFVRSTVFTSITWRTCKQWPLILFRICFSHPLHQSQKSSGWPSTALSSLSVAVGSGQIIKE